MANVVSADQSGAAMPVEHEASALPVEPAAGAETEVPAPGMADQELDLTKARTAASTLSGFLFPGEELNLIEISRLQEYKLNEVELSSDFLKEVSLSELKAESVRWHSAGDTVESDLAELDFMINVLQKRAKEQGLSEENARVTEGPFVNKSLQELLRFQRSSRWITITLPCLFRCHPPSRQAL